MHGKINFFLHNFDLLNFSKCKDPCISIKSPKYFLKLGLIHEKMKGNFSPEI